MFTIRGRAREKVAREKPKRMLLYGLVVFLIVISLLRLWTGSARLSLGFPGQMGASAYPTSCRMRTSRHPSDTCISVSHHSAPSCR